MISKLLNVYAQGEGMEINIKPEQTEGSLNVTGFTLSSILSTAVTYIMIFSAIIFFFMLLIGGVSWLTSGGDEQKVSAAKGRITNALIGLVIVLAAWAILSLVGGFFGLDLSKFTLPSITTK